MAETSFAAVAEEHLDAVYAFLLYVTGDRTVAEDLTGETFERALGRWRRLDPRRGTARTWLCQIARSAALDHFRSESRRRRREETYALQDVAAGEEVFGDGLSPELEAALPRADFVTIHCPKTPDTVGMFNAARLARMKPTAYLVNTARGGIIDEVALHKALTTGKLGGAGLDVFEQEPTPVANPLLKLANVISAPHMAGVTRESLDRMGVQTARNILSALDGRPIRENVINQEVLA